MIHATAIESHRYIVHCIYGAIWILMESSVLVILNSDAYCHSWLVMSLSALSWILVSLLTSLAKLSRICIGLPLRFALFVAIVMVVNCIIVIMLIDIQRSMVLYIFILWFYLVKWSLLIIVLIVYIQNYFVCLAGFPMDNCNI